MRAYYGCLVNAKLNFSDFTYAMVVGKDHKLCTFTLDDIIVSNEKLMVVTERTPTTE